MPDEKPKTVTVIVTTSMPTEFLAVVDVEKMKVIEGGLRPEFINTLKNKALEHEDSILEAAQIAIKEGAEAVAIVTVDGMENIPESLDEIVKAAINALNDAETPKTDKGKLH